MATTIQYQIIKAGGRMKRRPEMEIDPFCGSGSQDVFPFFHFSANVLIVQLLMMAGAGPCQLLSPCLHII
jgi:hypothetical protein